MIKGIGFDQHEPLPSLLPSEKHALCGRGFARHRLIINQLRSYRTGDRTSAPRSRCTPTCSTMGSLTGCSVGEPFLLRSESWPLLRSVRHKAPLIWNCFALRSQTTTATTFPRTLGTPPQHLAQHCGRRHTCCLSLFFLDRPAEYVGIQAGNAAARMSETGISFLCPRGAP